jgi:hypothetical protein
MSYRPKGKYVVVDPNEPHAIGYCDKTGSPFLKKDLVKQMEWRGDSLEWTGFLVGKPFADKPNEQGRAPLVLQDPVPVKNPRPPQSNFYNYPGPYIQVPEKDEKNDDAYWGRRSLNK